MEGLTAEQIAEYKESFSLFDRDHDGYITKQELATVLTRQLGMDPSDEDVEEMINEVAANGNSTIGFNDFLALMQKTLKEKDSEYELREAFKVFDKDNDGFITASEFWTVFASLGEKISHEEVDQLIREANANRGGQINYGEFVKIMSNE